MFNTNDGNKLAKLYGIDVSKVEENKINNKSKIMNKSLIRKMKFEKLKQVESVITSYGYFQIIKELGITMPKKLNKQKADKIKNLLVKYDVKQAKKMINIVYQQKENMTKMKNAIFMQYQKEMVKQQKELYPNKTVWMVPGKSEGWVRSFKSVKNRMKEMLKKFPGYKKSKSNDEIIGKDLMGYKEYMESKFTPEMNWDNYAVIWNNDHIQEIGKAKSGKEVEELSNYKNIVPMIIEDNCEKSNGEVK